VLNFYWLLLLLPVAAASGWIAGKKSSQKKRQSFAGLSRRYMVGLNYLLNEQSDKAIDTFIHLLQVDSETVETHLALGNLFRRRGEVDRALRLHQNIIARHSFNNEVKQMAMFELGLDYLAAGVLDRAEVIFEELKHSQPYKKNSLKQLLQIYQLTKDWEKAIQVAERLKLLQENYQNLCSHFHCEIAKTFIEQGELVEATRQLLQAEKKDATSVRVSMLQGKICILEKNWEKAIGVYTKLIRQDALFCSEILENLRICYQSIPDDQGYQSLLKEALANGASSKVLVALVESIRKTQGDKAAGLFLTQYLKDKPSLRGLQLLIELHLLYANDTAKESLLILQSLIKDLIHSRAVYLCSQCGLQSKQLYWQCPSCKTWGSNKPILTLYNKPNS